MPVISPSREFIGITGYPSSGKDTLADILVAIHGYTHVSSSDMVRAEARLRGFSPDQNVLHHVAKAMRSESGPDVLAIRSIEAYRERQAASDGLYAGVAITGLRAVAEAEAVQRAGGVVVFMDVTNEERYRRYVERSREGDVCPSFEAFCLYGEAERSSAGDPNAQDMDGIRAIADCILSNELPGKEFLEASAIELIYGGLLRI